MPAGGNWQIPAPQAPLLPHASEPRATLLWLQPVALAPLVQVSLVQALPSLQVVPSETWTQPVVALQVSVVQVVLSSQFLAVPPHAPELQASPVVHAFPSSQNVASGLLVAMHWPVAGSQACVAQGRSGQVTVAQRSNARMQRRPRLTPAEDGASLPR